MKKLEQNVIEKIELGVRELVITLNELPFITTIDSCEGHVYLPGDPKSLNAEKGKARILPAEIIFYMDRNNVKAANFLEDIQKLKSKYHFLKIWDEFKQKEIERSYGIETFGEPEKPPGTLEYFLWLGIKDITGTTQAGIGDAEKCKERKKQFSLVFEDVIKICGSYKE